MVILTL
jgi:hypothetical protein